MSEEYKSSKTRQVMNLINSPSSEISPFLIGVPKEHGNKKKQEQPTVESSLHDYTASKRGKTDKHTAVQSVPRNPSLHIPDEADEADDHSNNAAPVREQQAKKRQHTARDRITIDINRIILDDMLDEVLERFNTCHCDKCKEKLSELVLEKVPVKILTVSPGEEKSVIDSYCEYTRKEISSELVKIIVQNKRRPFHDM